MVVVVYRRHRADCRHKNERYSRACSCTLWLQFQDSAQHTTRVSTHTSDWEQAQRAADKAKRGERVTVSDSSIVSALEAYLAHMKMKNRPRPRCAVCAAFY
jgi:hypothetical protein